MHRKHAAMLGVAVALLAAAALRIAAQNNPGNPAGNAGKAPGGRGAAKAAGGGGGGGGFANSFPQRTPADPAILARGKALYEVNCGQCHAVDIRGGDSGPNLLRSQVLLNDKDGELLTPVLQAGRPAEGMPKFEFNAQQISDISAYIHSFRVAGYDGARNRPGTIVTGDAKAGEAYFKSRCGGCHSATGDMKGIGTRINDPRTLQQRWLLPTGSGRGGIGQATPTTVTVTLASGQKVEGRLIRVDDFLVTISDADGNQQSFRRDGNNPKVELHDPLQAHKDMIPSYTDKDIHNLTAYLVTLK